MYLSDLALTDFRSYIQTLIHIDPGVVILIGDNGQGKTNAVEAITYLATLSSHRVSSDAALIRQGAKAAVIQAKVLHGQTPTTLQVEIRFGRANRARINRGQVRPAEILGIVKTVVFAPEDLELIRGDPSARRAYLDSIMVQLRPRLAGVRTEYEKVMRQRGALLKSIGAARRRGASINLSSLDVWDLQLARLGAQITAARADIVSKLRPHVDRYYRELSNGSLMARIDYRANASQGHFELPTPENLSDAESIAAIEKHEGELADADFAEVRLIAELSERREAEMQRGVNLVGPHRDDLALTLGSLPARGYASHGESWSYALALKLAAWEILRADVSGEWAEDGEPILILDDVFSELDAGCRERLAGIVEPAGFRHGCRRQRASRGIERTAIACRRWKDESSGRGCRRCLRERSPERGVKPVERISSRCVNSTEFAKRLSLGERCGFASRWPHRRMTGRTMGTVRPLKNRLATRCGLLVPVGGMWVPVRVPPDAIPVRSDSFLDVSCAIEGGRSGLKSPPSSPGGMKSSVRLLPGTALSRNSPRTEL